MNDHSVRPNHVLHLIIEKVGLCDACLVPCVHSESPSYNAGELGDKGGGLAEPWYHMNMIPNHTSHDT